MKKGLLSILAGALLVVGCQNYDDQFSSLESQINALASTVAGLSQVQSDLASLSGTVSSLSSTVASLGSSIDTAVSNGLADITADIAALEAALADVASSSDLDAIAAAVAANQADLDELLANSSVYTGNITVNSVSTLDAYTAMGSQLAIINGNVDIDVSTDMDVTKVQTLVNQFLTITGNLDYTAASSTVGEVSFDNLTGVQTLTLTQGGGYVLPKLVSANKIYLSDTYKSSVDIIDFRSLTSVGTMGTDSYTSGIISFDKADEIHFTKLPRYGASLSITGKKGGVIDITALRDKDASGNQSALALTLSGPKSITIDQLDGKNGSISLTNVETAVINSYDGDITVNSGVENLTSDGVVEITFSSATDLETLVLKGVADPNHIASTATPVDYGDTINLDGYNNLDSVTITGTWTSVEFDSCTNLTSATISADVTGSAGINLNGNSDLETLDLTGSKAAKVTIDDNDTMTSAIVNTTIRKTSTSGSTLDGTIIVTNNADLASLTISSKDVSTLTITDNASLAKIDASGLTTLGAGGTTASPTYPTVSIYSNALVASLAQDKTNATGCSSCSDLEANDLGAFTTTSGMETLKTYLALVVANSNSDASVYFDTVASTVNATGTETLGSTLYSTGTTASSEATVVLEMSAGTPATYQNQGAAVASKAAYLITSHSVGGPLSVKESNTEILTLDGSTFGAITLSSDPTLAVSQIKNSAALARATALDFTLDAFEGGNPTLPAVLFYDSAINTSTNYEHYTNAQAGALTSYSTNLVTSDIITISIDGLSASITPTTADISVTANIAQMIAFRLAHAWNIKYGTNGASANLTYWNDLTTGTTEQITGGSLKSSHSGRSAHGDVVRITTSLSTTSTLDWKIGSTDATTDNAAVGTDIILTAESLIAGFASGAVLSSTLTVSSTYGTSNLVQNLSTNLRTVVDAATDTSSTIYPLLDRTDSRYPEAASEGTIATAAVAAVAQTRVHWLGA